MTDAVLINGLIEATDSLSSVFQKEIDLLRAKKPGALDSVQDEKAALADRYAGGAVELVRRKVAVAAAEPGLRQALKSATKALTDRMVENLHLIKSAKSLNERLVIAIRDAVAGERLLPPGYAADGSSESTTRSGSPISLTLDQRI